LATIAVMMQRLAIDHFKTNDMIEKEFLQSTLKRFREYRSLGEKTMAQLSDADLNWQPNPDSNSIAIIIQHLSGNMLSRWTNFLSEDGEKDWRQRDAEFEPQALNREELLLQWEKGWTVLLETLESLSESQLSQTVTIRAQPLTVVDAIHRQLAHYSYHVGQIVFIGKWLLGDRWNSLTIPKNKSSEYNRQMKQSRH
jgi:hypothetical protein